MENGLCKICGAERKKIFEKKILGKHKASYFKCLNCGFVQTEKPYWLDESYSSAITAVDVGLVNRNIQCSDVVEKIIYEHFDKHGKFLDFAGGYGLLTRIMRDKGFDFYREDKYCENIFAKYFDIEDLPQEKRKFELATAFELMEHVENPFKELDYIFSMTGNLLFSTELIPDKDFEGWWYIGVEHGQHISFYTKKSLEKIAEKYGKTYFPNGNMHLITDKKNGNFFQEIPKSTKFFRRSKKVAIFTKKMPSKTWQDYEMIIKKTKNNV
jgi:hypothetical protein